MSANACTRSMPGLRILFHSWLHQKMFCNCGRSFLLVIYLFSSQVCWNAYSYTWCHSLCVNLWLGSAQARFRTRSIRRKDTRRWNNLSVLFQTTLHAWRKMFYFRPGDMHEIKMFRTEIILLHTWNQGLRYCCVCCCNELQVAEDSNSVFSLHQSMNISPYSIQQVNTDIHCLVREQLITCLMYFTATLQACWVSGGEAHQGKQYRPLLWMIYVQQALLRLWDCNDEAVQPS